MAPTIQSPAFELLTLAGNVALLLWGLHMVHSGLVRALGAELRLALGRASDRRWKAFLAGLGVTALTQSSNATGLMASRFVAAGLVGLVPALAVMLGANVGTTLIVFLLSFDAAAFAPLLVLAGVVAFRRASHSRIRDLGRVSIGLGLVLIALAAIAGVVGRMEHTGTARAVLYVVAGDTALAISMGAALAWAAHSSVVVVLLAMSLAASHIIGLPGLVTLVLGANLGTALPQLLAAGTEPSARRLAIGNLLIKALGALAVVLALPLVERALPLVTTDPVRQGAIFHLAFNLALATATLPALDAVARLLCWLVPPPPARSDRAHPRYIVGASDTAAVALANGEREVLRLVDLVEDMLRALARSIETGDRRTLSELSALDDSIDRLHRSVKLYLIGISRRDDLEPADAQRCSELLAFTINLEHAGDILDRSLRSLARKKIEHKLTFSAEGQAEIRDMHRHVMRQLSLSVGALMTGDPRVARSLLDDKVAMREMEAAAARNHLERLREGRAESIDTSTLHLDIIRDLKRITAHLASVAYPIMERRGELQRSRLTTAA